MSLWPSIAAFVRRGIYLPSALLRIQTPVALDHVHLSVHP